MITLSYSGRWKNKPPCQGYQQYSKGLISHLFPSGVGWHENRATTEANIQLIYSLFKETLCQACMKLFSNHIFEEVSLWCYFKCEIKLEKKCISFISNIFSIRCVDYDKVLYEKISDKNIPLCSTNYFLVAKALKHNKNKPRGYQINVNRTKCMEVQLAWRVSGMRCKDQHFFFLYVPSQNLHMQLLVTRQHCWCTVSLKVSL